MTIPARAAALSTAVLVAALSTTTGCGSKEETLGPADQTYTVRGRVQAVLEDELAVAHEAIPAFVGRSGDTVGMQAMTMTFYRPANVSTEGISVGDPVELTFEVRWSGDHRLTIASIRALPADTALELAE